MVKAKWGQELHGPLAGASVMSNWRFDVRLPSMNNYGALISAEFRQAPDAVRRQAVSLAQPLRELVGFLRKRQPQVVVTCARGSSAHAATFGNYHIEPSLGVPVVESTPNLTSIYHK